MRVRVRDGGRCGPLSRKNKCNECDNDQTPMSEYVSFGFAQLTSEFCPQWERLPVANDIALVSCLFEIIPFPDHRFTIFTEAIHFFPYRS
jgi:hypothetical protein